MTRYLIHILLLLQFAPAVVAQDIVIDSIVATPVTCNGFSDGSITVYVTGGSGELEYSLATSEFIPLEKDTVAARSYTFTGYPEGDYFIGVKDFDNSTDNSGGFINIPAPDAIEIISVNVTDLTCSGSGEGAINVTASGESGSFIFTLSGPVNDVNSDGIFSSLQAGIYDVNVSDALGCPGSDDSLGIEISEPPAITATAVIADVVCFGDFTGGINLTPGGGSGSGYTFAWTGPNGFNSTDEDIAGLEAGNYNVTITDGNGCSEDFGPFTVEQNVQITFTLDASSDVSCNGNSDGAASITPAGGVGPYTYNWDGQTS
ncbi:MAG: SprB repeat-containing protein, partial [Bacteroidales bacterium]|nr:SprB repeat-containing protein [Bacteroidales bacterium]